MVWIAVGGYFVDGGGLSLYGPQYFLDNDLVLVTMNYRLGALGILLNIYLFVYKFNMSHPLNKIVLIMEWMYNNLIVSGLCLMWYFPLIICLYDIIDTHNTIYYRQYR